VVVIKDQDESEVFIIIFNKFKSIADSESQIKFNNPTLKVKGRAKKTLPFLQINCSINKYHFCFLYRI